MSEQTHNIVILGASFAGLKVAHGLLKALPALKTQTKKDYKVTIISNTTHFWWSVGAPRAMLKPYPKDNSDSFIPIAQGFKTYPSPSYEIIHAEITCVDTQTQDTIYKLKDGDDNVASEEQKIHFDTLVIATGSTGVSPLYALQGSHVPTLNAYKDVQARLPAAKTVLVVGAGPAGVETAGELGELHGKKTSSPKDITILSGRDRLLPDLRPSIGQRAQEILDGMGVKAEHNLRMESFKQNPDGKNEISLSDGSIRIVDLLLVATGRTPASSFLPAHLLDTHGRVKVDEYLRIPSVKSIYALGDVCSASEKPGGILHLETAAPVTVGNVIAELGGKEGKPHKSMTQKEMQLVPVGPGGGVGAIFGWWVPSFMVKQIKSKTFFFPKAMQTVQGKA